MFEFEDILIYVLVYFGLFTSFYFLIILYKYRNEIYAYKPKKYPLITIAIPVFNGEEVLQETADSLLKLKYPKDKLDLIIVDDGSKDDTYKIAKKYEKKGFRVFKLSKNKGKGAALNLALSKSKGEFFGALDADSYATPLSLKKLMPYFDDPEVMAVTPAMRIHDPKTFLQRVQQIEYLIGILLRKIFSFFGSLHVTPGPLSIYRKKFFDDYGGYDEENLPEDIEIALRIQKNDYKIENSILADVYTRGPKDFRTLLRQRLRWYKGFIDNVINYKTLFSKEQGNLGLFILPAAFFSVLLVILMMFYTIYKFVDTAIKNIINLNAIHFDILTNIKNINFDIFFLNMSPEIILSFFLLIIGILTLIIAKKISKDKSNIGLSYVYYAFGYWFLFGFWWLVALYYKIFNKKLEWGKHKI